MSYQPAPHPQTLPLVRDRVRQVLTSAPAYQGLDNDTRRDVARAMVNIGQYLVDAGGDTHDAPVALTLADPPADTAGGDFAQQGGAVGAQSGAAALEGLVSKVDFPKFVAGLIDGVFNAIVTSSIKQMQAYAELVKNVSKSVDDFMKDNVSENQARDYLADRYPDHLEVDISGEKPKVKPKDGADQDTMPDFFKDLGLSEPVDSIEDDTPEQILLPAARQRMAIDRQHLLLTMVVMGINRLIVTDGSIKASVMFNLDTKDSVTRGLTGTNTRTYHDTSHSEGTGPGYGFLRSIWSNTWKDDAQSDLSVSTVTNSSSAASVDLHAKLSGDVNIRFKSDVFPLDQVTNILGIEKPEVPSGAGPIGAPATTPGSATISPNQRTAPALPPVTTVPR